MLDSQRKSRCLLLSAVVFLSDKVPEKLGLPQPLGLFESEMLQVTLKIMNSAFYLYQSVPMSSQIQCYGIAILSQGVESWLQFLSL